MADPDAIDIEQLRREAKARGMTIAIVDVLAERHRQRAGEGFSTAHDDAYHAAELIRAAICYAVSAMPTRNATELAERASWWIGPLWPWKWIWWKPKTPRADLVRAAALLIAEIERIDRLTERTEHD